MLSNVVILTKKSSGFGVHDLFCKKGHIATKAILTNQPTLLINN